MKNPSLNPSKMGPKRFRNTQKQESNLRVVISRLVVVWTFANPWTVVLQVSLSMESCRQEHQISMLSSRGSTFMWKILS